MMTNLTLQERRALRKMKHEEWRNHIIQCIPFVAANDLVFVAEESTPVKTNIMLNHDDWSNQVDPTLSYYEQNESTEGSEQTTSQLSSPRSQREAYSTAADEESQLEDEIPRPSSSKSGYQDEIPSSSSEGGSSGNIGSNKILAWREKRKKLVSKEKEKESEIIDIQKQEDDHIHELCDEIEILAQHISHKILTDQTRPARRLSTAKLRLSPSKTTKLQRIRFNVMVILVNDYLFFLTQP